MKVDDDVPSHAVITGTDLLIENLNKSYNGTYRCVASNSVGESYDDYILYVYGMYGILESISSPSTSQGRQRSPESLLLAELLFFCDIVGFYSP